MEMTHSRKNLTIGDYGDSLRAYSEAFDKFQRQNTREHEERLWQITKTLPNTILEELAYKPVSAILKCIKKLLNSRKLASLITCA